MDCIEDLFYDGKDPEAEILRVQSAVDANSLKLQALYSNTVGDKGMNRKAFQKMAIKQVGQEVEIAADEIFSNVTNLYGEAEDPVATKDVTMSTSQFVGGIIRLANLKAMMLDGMVDTSELALQTEKFLRGATV